MARRVTGPFTARRTNPELQRVDNHGEHSDGIQKQLRGPACWIRRSDLAGVA
jgi:hypothetical protein